MGNIYIGVYIAHLDMPWVHSLKEKRALITPVTEKLKVRFPVSVARLAWFDDHDREMIGATAISHDPVWLEGMLNKVGSFVETSGGFRVSHSSVEVELWSDD